MGVGDGDPTIFRDRVASDQYLAERVKPEIRDIVFRLQPSATPLTNLTRGLKKTPSENFKFSWLKDEILPFHSAISATTNQTVVTIQLESNKGFPVGTIAFNSATNEHVLVTGRDGRSTILVTRGVGETGSATMVSNGSALYAIGRAYTEDATLGSIYMTKVTVDYNYCQIFRTPIGGSGRDGVTALYGGRNRPHQRLMRGLEHRRDIENAFIWGERYQSASSGSTKQRTTTRGVLKWMSSNTVDAAGTITETEFDGLLRSVSIYDDSSMNRLLLASDILIEAIGYWAKNKGTYELSGAHRYYGVELVDYHTPFGMVHIGKASQTLVGSYTGPNGTGYYAGTGIALDMSDLGYRHMAGRDTNLLINRQENDRDGWRDEWLTDAGLEVHFEQKHGWIYDFDAYA